MRQFTLGLAVIGALLLSGPGAGPAKADITSLSEAMTEHVLGDPNAPVTIIEYASMSCGHCAHFALDTLPDVKKNYIETGKARLVFHDFPLGGLALAASMLNRCSTGDTKRFFGFQEVMFRSLPQWAASETPREDLTRMARFAGLSEDDVFECFENEELQKAIIAKAEEGQKKYQVNSTPTFVINGKIVRGALSYEDFSKILDDALAAAGK